VAERETYRVPPQAGSPPQEGARASRRLTVEWVVIPACFAVVFAVVLLLALLL
jgi:hypothetical protein